MELLLELPHCDAEALVGALLVPAAMLDRPHSSVGRL